MAERTSWQAAADPRRRIGHAVEVHARIGSTNDRARELLDEGLEGVAIVAEEQIAGRGRRGRAWSSPAGVNVMVSVGFRPRLRAGDAWQLGEAVALAARAACPAAAGVGLKWPNDLVSERGRKIAGILVETAVDGDHVAAAVAGVGLNANWPIREMPEEIRDTATSLQELTGAPVDRVAVLDALLTALDAEIASLEAGRSPLDRYRSACRTIGAEVTVGTHEGPLMGRAIDLDETGALLVQTEHGLRAITSGEVIAVRSAVPA